MICLFKIRFELVNMTFALCFNVILVKKIGCFWLYVTNVTVTYVMPFSERLKMEFHFWTFWRCARLISDENMHVCKYESKVYMKTKHKSIQKSCFCRPDVHFQPQGLDYHIMKLFIKLIPYFTSLVFITWNIWPKANILVANKFKCSFI